MHGFLERIGSELQENGIVKFRVGRRKICFVTGPQNIRALFRPSRSLNADTLMLDVMEYVWAANRDELLKFRLDKSGRMLKPLPGTENMPQNERYWATQHHVFAKFFMQSDATNRLSELYYDFLLQKIDMIPLGTWKSDTVKRFMMGEMSECAVLTIFGTRILEINPGFMEAMWEFMLTIAEVPFGPPRWMNPQPWRNRDRFHTMTRKYLDAAWANFDWQGPDADADWEPHFGARGARELAKWMKETLSPQTSAGNVAAVIFGTNANATRMTIWGLMELIKDPILYKDLRNDVLEKCLKVDPATGARALDTQEMLRLPLLQSIIAEILRLHISVNASRKAIQPLTLDGYTVEEGDILQASSQLAHYDEEVWGETGHPASEFWAQRHISYTKKIDASGQVINQAEFNMTGKTGSYFPYGGGVSICPGRHLAKQEMMLTLGTIAARFDIEFLNWMNKDGSKSEIPAQNDKHFAGAVGVPPDRDLKYRWKRLW